MTNHAIKKTPAFDRGFYKFWQRHTLPQIHAVPSALAGLTTLFGMGRGGHRR